MSKQVNDSQESVEQGVEQGVRGASLQDLVSHAKKYGFVFPSSEIYGGLRAVYDYGPLGSLLKGRLVEAWRRAFLHGIGDKEISMHAFDASIFMHSKVWEASGHTAQFDDYFVDNKDSQRRYRVDELISSTASRWEAESKPKEAHHLLSEGTKLLHQGDLKGLGALLREKEVLCEKSRTAHWTEVRKMALMFETEAGAVEKEPLFLRPETAQGIYVHFQNILQSTRSGLPLGVIQVGKAFRNELITRQFILRTREFEQMEMQFFFSPKDSRNWLEYWTKMRLGWYEALGFSKSRLRIKKHTQLAHYTKEAYDIEYAFSFGWKEIEGIHHRGQWDLDHHQSFSKKNLMCLDLATGTKVLPEIIECSCGLNRLFLAFLSEFFHQDSRLVLRFPPFISPYQVAVFPLVKRDGLAEKARAIADQLSMDWRVVYEQSASIGKRYARQDAIGTPFCLTIDYQTREDNTITIREAHSAKQERLSIDAVDKYLHERCHLKELVKKQRALSLSISQNV